ncbi:MAG: hypothetical protein K1X57_16355 [Gemmataceae bacterium]|nr:hypothetical protein [Gemmataceae bacterium]
MKRLLALAVVLTAGAAGPAQDPAVNDILKRFDAARPDTKSLAFFSLDWEPTLKAALARSKTERRPVFLIANTNITAGCNFYSGHT